MAETEVNNNIYGEDDDENNPDLERNSSILAGLNLALILTSLTLSDEEFQNFEEMEKKEKEIQIGEGKGKICRMNTVSKRVQGNEFRAGERQMAKANKTNAKIKKDCRHGRKM